MIVGWANPDSFSEKAKQKVNFKLCAGELCILMRVEEILSGDERQTGGNVDQIISQIRNMTDFNSAGERITGCSRYPSIDGSCNHGSGKI